MNKIIIFLGKLSVVNLGLAAGFVALAYLSHEVELPQSVLRLVADVGSTWLFMWMIELFMAMIFFGALAIMEWLFD